VVLQVEDEIRELVATHAGLAISEATLAGDTDLFNAGMTSYASVTVLMSLEDHFGITFPDSLIRRGTFQTIAAMTEAVSSLLDSSPSR